MRAELRNRVYYGEVVRMQPEFGAMIDDDTGIVRLSVMWLDEPGLVVFSNFDRLLLQYEKDNFIVSAGRQRINWGINTVWNPNDIFNAWNFLDFDYEERNGTDAVRIRYFTSGSSSFDFAWHPSTLFRHHIAAMLYRTNFRGYDVQAMAGKYNQDIVLGGGFAGALKKTGFKGEVTCFYPYGKSVPEEMAYSFSVSLDRTLKGNWFVNGSILYCSEEANFQTMLAGSTRSDISVRQLMPWRWNVYLQGMKQISPPVSAGLAVCWTPTDFNTIYLPTIRWVVADDYELDLVGQCFFRKEGDGYNAVANSLYLRMRMSF